MICNLKQNLFAFALLSCSAGLVGCSTSAKPAASGETNKTTATVEQTNKSASTPPASRDAPKDSTAAAPSGDKIGVAECDDYIEKYEACIRGKVPESTRATIESSFEQTRKTWKDLAANPQTKSSLGAMCKQSKEAAKQSMGAYQCEW